MSGKRGREGYCKKSRQRDADVEPARGHPTVLSRGSKIRLPKKTPEGRLSARRRRT
jgi:hypothetical protein